MEPFVKTFQGQAAAPHARTSVCGLLADVKRTNIAAMAYRFGQSRLPLQGFLGWDAWDDAPLRHALLVQGTTHLGPGDGVLVFEPSGFAKAGRESVGVARPWGGRLGQVDNGQGALSLGSVSSQGHPRVATRLSLPKAWPPEKARRDTAGVPQAVRGDRTRHQWALALLANHGARLPHRWLAGADALGRPAWLRRRLVAWGERSRLAVPSHPARRALEGEPPASRGRGRRPTRPGHTVAAWSQSLGEEAWRRSAVRDGAKGPLVVEAGKRRVGSRTPRRQQGEAEMVVVLRSRDRDHQQGITVDSSRSHAGPETPRWACARVATAEQRFAACLPRSQSEAGWADYAGRHWTGWQQQHTLSLLATWCLVWDTERGKTMDPCHHLPADASGPRHELARGVSVWDEVASAEGVPEALATQCAGSLLALEPA
jgi:DDE superfamily endonuclease